MSNVIAYIMLRESSSRTDIPRVLVCCDYFNSYEMGEIDRLIFRAKLVDINYDVFISAKTEHKQRSPEHCLKQRLRSLENRAKKHCSLFWEEVVKEEVAKNLGTTRLMELLPTRPRWKSILPLQKKTSLLPCLLMNSKTGSFDIHPLSIPTLTDLCKRLRPRQKRNS